MAAWRWRPARRQIRRGAPAGRVMSLRVPKGDDIYQAVEHGFWPFAVLYAAEFGLRDFHFISRTNRGTWHSHHRRLGQVEAWVVRLIRSTGLFEMGLSELNVHLTKHKSGPEGKGPKCEEDGIVLTHMIDNDLECLWSVVHEAGQQQVDHINAVIQYTGVRAAGSKWDPRDDDLLLTMGSFHEVAGALLLLEGASGWVCVL